MARSYLQPYFFTRPRYQAPLDKFMKSMTLKVSLLAMLATCIFVDGQGNGNANGKQVGDTCMCRYGTDDGFDGVFHYFESPTPNGKCSDAGDLVCLTELDDGTFGEDFVGSCQDAACVTPLDDAEGKITICHRTCAENNPWIRITIDASAWSAHSCGHTTETCEGKDLQYWEPFQQDFVLKQHGTRDEVAAMLGDDAELIKAYWQHWEPACTSSRNGKSNSCCEFDGEYGYSCCRRAVEDPEMPEDFTAAPVALVTEVPVATPAPSAATPAPVTTQETPAPADPQATPAPSMSPVDGGGGGGGPEGVPQCSNRRLQDMEERWSITEPKFQYQRSLSFHLDFEVSDFISMENMVSHTLMDGTCTNSYGGSGLLHTRGLRLPTNEGRQKIGVAVWVDPTKIAQDKEVYSEGLVGDQMMGNVDFCVRFAVRTPPNTPGGSLEVNFMEVVVNFDATLTDGFEIGEMTAAPRDRCEKEADEAFEVEGYFCETGNEAEKIDTLPTLNQGSVVKICVRPKQEARDLSIRMRNIQSFTFTGDNGLEQEAIVDYQAASNGLTQLWCDAGYAICHFETMLRADFYAEAGVVTGFGVADMQFGGESSASSVSPEQRRRMRQRSGPLLLKQGASSRKLQDVGEASGSGEFAMEFSTADGSDEYSDISVTAAPTTKVEPWLILLAGCVMAAMLVSLQLASERVSAPSHKHDQ